MRMPCSSSFDARTGLLPTDVPFAELVRKSGKPVISARQQGGEPDRDRQCLMTPTNSASASRSPFPAKHGTGLDELYDQLRELLPDAVEDEEAGRGDDDPVRIATFSGGPMPANPR